MTDPSTGDGDPPALPRREELVQALLAREEYLSPVVGSLESCVLIDQDWRFSFANPAALRLARLPLEEMLGRDLRELVPADVMERALPSLEKAMRDRAPVEFDAVDGTTSTIYRVRAIPLADGGLALYLRDVTRLVRDEAALRESEERYRQLFQAESDAVVLIDQESGRVLEANAAAEAMYGYSAEEFLELDALQLSAEPELSRAAISDAAPGETAVVPLRLHRRKDGSTFPVEITGRVFELQGRPVRIAAIRDVSERERTALALRESEEVFRAIFDQSVVGKVQADPMTGRFLRVNEAFCRLTGYDAEYLVGRTFFDITHPDDRASDAGNLVALREGRIDSFEAEKRYVRPDGTIVWGHISVNLVRDADGEPLFTVAVVQDVNARKLAEEALRESEERFRVLFEDHGAVMLLVDPGSGRILDANAAAAGFYGYSRERLQRMRIQQINQLPAGEVAAERRRAADHTKTMFAFPHKLANGDVRFVEVYSSPVMVDGRLTLFSIIHDITDRKRAEADLLRNETEKAAQQERIRLARDLHDSVTQALFAATLKAEALTEGDDRLRVEALADDVRRLSRGALAQMRTLLLELRGDPIEQMPLQQLLRNLVEAAESRAKVDVWLSVECKRPLPAEVHVAVYRVTQEALNNVARHAGATNAWVELRCRSSEVRLSVRDDGRGFDPASVEPGHYGLTSMRERADELGASLEVGSAPEEGTEVVLTWRRP